MISPKTHPQFYRTLQIFQYAWLVPIWIWNQLSDDIRDAIREAYKKVKPEELESGLIDEVKFVAWWNSQEKVDRDFYNKAVLKTICVPKDGAPAMEGEYYDLLSSTEINGIINFTRPASIGSDSKPTDATASATSTEASGANTPVA